MKTLAFETLERSLGLGAGIQYGVVMALVRNWRIIKYGGPTGDVRDICKTLDLRGCKRILIKFDPFREDSKHVRDFNHLILSFRASKTNPNIIVRTEVLCDRADPSITLDLTNGEKVLMNCTHLKLVDIFKVLNEYSTPLAPVDSKEETTKKLKLKKGKK